MAIIQDLQDVAARWGALGGAWRATAAAVALKADTSDTIRAKLQTYTAAAKQAAADEAQTRALHTETADLAAATANTILDDSMRASGDGRTQEAAVLNAAAREITTAMRAAVDAYRAAGDALLALWLVGERLTGAAAVAAGYDPALEQLANDAADQNNELRQILKAMGATFGAAFGGLAGLAILAIGGALAWRLLRSRR